MRLVVDTNVLMTSLPRRSFTRWLWDAICARNVELCVSTEIALEYEEVIERQAAPEVAMNVLEVLALLPTVVYVVPVVRWHLIADDPDDDKFVDAAVAGGADALITYDRHFDVLSLVDFPRVNVLTPEALRPLLDLA